MKFNVVLLSFGLMLGACQKEDEAVDVKKVLSCWGIKGVLKKEACVQALNNSELQALACLTSKDSSSKCKDISLKDIRFSMERESGPAKERGTQFKLDLNGKTVNQ